MIIRDSESRCLAFYCCLILLLALILPYVIIFFLPISFFLLTTLRTWKNQHYNVHLNSKIIPRPVAVRGPPFSFLLLNS
ncbi:MAG: hypothetical protein GY950_15740 [bacterium]|nr:hypothetical protein [bacterium]